MKATDVPKRAGALLAAAVVFGCASPADERFFGVYQARPTVAADAAFSRTPEFNLTINSVLILRPDHRWERFAIGRRIGHGTWAVTPSNGREQLNLTEADPTVAGLTFQATSSNGEIHLAEAKSFYAYWRIAAAPSETKDTP